MARIFPPEVLEEVQSRNDIVEVVSRYFPLKRSGQNYRALCPFHSERTPSFFVNPQRQIFHCFGCGVGGDVFSFVMRQENLTFPEAVRFLAERVGFELPSPEPGLTSRREQILKLHELAADFFHWGLIKSRGGAAAREYLAGRGIRAETVTAFRLGYAQPSWDSFCTQARKKGYPADLLVEAGLALKRSGGPGHYDRFRHRLVIPVCDAQGRVIAFGGRVLNKEQPKYINSPDTPIFRKGQMLFGLHLAKGAIGKAGEAILGEGYFDVIRAHQEGIKNLICSQGTAFTLVQAQVLKRYIDKVVTAFDADQAGAEASLRGLAIFLQKNFEVRIALLPPGEDPDSFIGRSGAGAFLKAVKNSVPLIDFKLEKLCEKHDVQTDRGKLLVVREMLQTISQIESEVLKDSYVKKLARALSVSEASVWGEFGKQKPDFPRDEAKTPPPSAWEKNEIALLKMVMADDRVIDLISDDLDPTDFSLPLRPVAEKIRELHRSGQLPLAHNLTLALRQREHQDLISNWLLSVSSSAPSRRELVDVLLAVKRKGLKARLHDLSREVERAEKEGGDVARLQRESITLRRKLEELPRKLREKYSA